jgi:hypothetical protein
VRRPKLERPTQLCLKLPESVRAQLDLLLYSELEGRVPLGAYQEFFVERIREFLSWRRLPLERFGFPAGFFVAGPREMIEELERRLLNGN